MTLRTWSGMALGVSVACAVTFGMATNSGVHEPWPALLAEPQAIDPQIAALQLRANLVLNQLEHPEPPADPAL